MSKEGAYGIIGQFTDVLRSSMAQPLKEKGGKEGVNGGKSDMI